MGLPEAKAAYATLKTELEALTNLFDKYNLLINMKRYTDNKLQQTTNDIKNAPPPAKLSDIKNYYIVDELYNKYTVDKDGNLTKV
jgi:hypothetical protein